MRSTASLATSAAGESQVDEELILSLTQQSQSQWRESLLHYVHVHCSCAAKIELFLTQLKNFGTK